MVGWSWLLDWSVIWLQMQIQIQLQIRIRIKIQIQIRTKIWPSCRGELVWLGEAGYRTDPSSDCLIFLLTLTTCSWNKSKCSIKPWICLLVSNTNTNTKYKYKIKIRHLTASSFSHSQHAHETKATPRYACLSQIQLECKIQIQIQLQNRNLSSDFLIFLLTLTTCSWNKPIYRHICLSHNIGWTCHDKYIINEYQN